MENTNTIPEMDPGIPNNAVSLYGQQDAMDDFPVLKAFQQYVDAEQAKAQKRMTTLCIFFAIVLTLVITVFVTLLLTMGQRNQSDTNQLIQYLLKERDRAPVVVQTAPSTGYSANGAPLATPQANNDAALQALIQSIDGLKRQMTQDEAPGFITTAPSAQSNPEKDVSAQLRAAQEKIKAEREAMEKEKERLHQQEIELQKRRLYPECYNPDGSLKTPEQRLAEEKQRSVELPSAAPVPVVESKQTPPAPSKPVIEVTEEDLADIPLDAYPDEDNQTTAPAKPTEKKDDSRTYYEVPKTKEPIGKKNSDGSISYFDEEETSPSESEAAQPSANNSPSKENMRVTVDTNGSISGWEIPLD